MTSRRRLLNAELLREMALGFQKSRILLTAYELGVFSALGRMGRTSREAGRILKTNTHATERLMNALCALGLLKKKKDKFLNTPFSLRFLVKGSPDFMGGLMHSVQMWDTWSSLTQAVRDGRSTRARSLDKRDTDWLTRFICAMHERAASEAKVVVSLLDLSGVSSVLDVGGGSGAYAMAFVRAQKGIKATLFDLPKVVPLARGYIRQEGLLNKIKTVSGNYLADDLGSGFDLVFLSAIIHINSPSQNRALIAKCAKALNSDGELVVQDFIMDENRTKPAFGAFFALNMLVATESGDTYTGSEVMGWMRQAGLSGIKRKDTDSGATLIIGRKIGHHRKR